MTPSGPELLFVGSFLITASISLSIICLFIFSILSDLFLNDCILLGIYPFDPRCLVCWHVVRNIFLQSFLFLWCPLSFLLFHFRFYLSPFSFVLGESGKCLSILFIFSKNHRLDSLIFCIIFWTLFHLFLLWSLLFPSL